MTLMSRLALWTVAGALAFAVSACPNGQRQQQPRTARPAEWTEEAAHEVGRELSLFRETPMMPSPPDAISFSRDASKLWVHGLDPTSSEFYVGQVEVGTDK